MEPVANEGNGALSRFPFSAGFGTVAQDEWDMEMAIALQSSHLSEPRNDPDVCSLVMW